METMSAKSNLSAEQWSTVLAGPPAAGLRIVLAERGGMIRESIAMGRAYQEARQNHGSSEVLDEIVAEQPAMNPQELQSATDLPSALMERVRASVRVLEENASPGDVDAYKRFVLDLATQVARAKKEGGVLGIGGKEISDSEQAGLDELAAELGIEQGGAA